MKSFAELNYYQILNIPENASFIEIKRAYKHAVEIYKKGSLATYSLFSDQERVNLLEEIEKAYTTLADENERAGYDRNLANSCKVHDSIIVKQTQKKPIPLKEDKKSLSADDLARRIENKLVHKEVKDLLTEIFGKDLISGYDLKKLRKAFGIEIFEIYAVTRISVSVLRKIEEDQYENLPADVYLNHFLSSYAKILQLDAPRVIDGYYQTRSLELSN